MKTVPQQRDIHPDFRFYLDFKDAGLIALYTDLRRFVLDLCPDATEMLYHTHALTSVYSTSNKLGDAFCMIPIYTGHLNLGFNCGTLLPDPSALLQGAGKLIRHIPVTGKADYDSAAVKALIKEAMEFATKNMEGKPGVPAQIISKIKT